MNYKGTQNWIRHLSNDTYEVMCKNSQLSFIVTPNQLRKIRNYTWTTHPAGSENICVRPTINGRQFMIKLVDVLGVQKGDKFKNGDRFDFTPENIIKPGTKEYNFKRYKNAPTW